MGEKSLSEQNFCRSIWQGMPVTVLLLWQRENLGGRGQTSLSLPSLRDSVGLGNPGSSKGWGTEFPVGPEQGIPQDSTPTAHTGGWR